MRTTWCGYPPTVSPPRYSSFHGSRFAVVVVFVVALAFALIALCSVVFRCIALRCVALYCVVLRCVVLCYVAVSVLCCVAQRRAWAWDGMECGVVCGAVCCAMLCRAVWCASGPRYQNMLPDEARRKPKW